MAEIAEETRQGTEFTGKPKKVSWERLWTFSGGPFGNTGWPRKNIHTDVEFARSCALPYVAASGTQFQGYVVELLVDLFGVEWLSYGTMDVRFINIVDRDDTLVPRAAVTSRETRDDVVTFVMDVSCENQNGSKVLVGSSTGAVGKMNPAELRPEVSMPEAQEQPSLKPLEFVVTPELNQQCLYAVEDFHPWYIEETEFGPPMAHPALLLNMSNGTKSPSYSIPSGRAGFHARDEAFFLNPARLGKKLTVTWNPREGYEKRGRPYSVNETLVVDEDGMTILKRLSHSTVASAEYKREYRK